ncbi:FadR/GntR family transcriptional regulator [Yinghuangia aomiensis]
MAAIKLGVVPPGGRFPRNATSPPASASAASPSARPGARSSRPATSKSAAAASAAPSSSARSPLPEPGEARRRAEDMGPALGDALTFRQVLEVGAVQVLAARGLTEAQRELLLARLTAVDTAAPEDYRRLDTAFHLTLAELAGSSSLTAAAADVRMRLNDLLNAIPVLDRNIAHSAVQHQAIVESVLAGDPDAARLGHNRTPRRHGGIAPRIPGLRALPHVEQEPTRRRRQLRPHHLQQPPHPVRDPPPRSPRTRPAPGRPAAPPVDTSISASPGYRRNLPRSSSAITATRMPSQPSRCG